MAEHLLRFVAGFEPYHSITSKESPTFQHMVGVEVEGQGRDQVYIDRLDGCDTEQAKLGNSVKSATLKHVREEITSDAYTGERYGSRQQRPAVTVIDGNSWLHAFMAWFLTLASSGGQGGSMRWSFVYDNFCEMIGSIQRSGGGSTIFVCFDNNKLAAEGKHTTQRKRKRSDLQRAGSGGSTDSSTMDFEVDELPPWCAKVTRKERLNRIDELENLLIPSTNPMSEEYGDLSMEKKLLKSDKSMEEIFDDNDVVTELRLKTVMQHKGPFMRGIVRQVVYCLRNQLPTYTAGGRFRLAPGSRLVISGHGLDEDLAGDLFVQEAGPDSYQRDLPHIYQNPDPAMRDVAMKCTPLCFFSSGYGDGTSPVERFYMISENKEGGAYIQRDIKSPLVHSILPGIKGDWMYGNYDAAQGREPSLTGNTANDRWTGSGPRKRFLRVVPVPQLFCLLGEADYQFFFMIHRAFKWGLGEDFEIICNDSDMVWMSCMYLFQKFIRRGRIRMPQIYLNALVPGSTKAADICDIEAYIACLQRFVQRLGSEVDNDQNYQEKDQAKKTLDKLTRQLHKRYPRLKQAEVRGVVAQYLETNWSVRFGSASSSSSNAKGSVPASASDAEGDYSKIEQDLVCAARDGELNPLVETIADSRARKAPPPVSEVGTVPDWLQYVAFMMLCGNDVARSWPGVGFTKFDETFRALYINREHAATGPEGPWRIISTISGRTLVYDVPRLMHVIHCALAQANLSAFNVPPPEKHQLTRSQFIVSLTPTEIAERVERQRLGKGQIHEECSVLRYKVAAWSNGRYPALSKWFPQDIPRSLDALRLAVSGCIPPPRVIVPLLKAHAGYLYSLSQTGRRCVKFLPPEKSGYVRRADGELYYDLGFPYIAEQ